MAASPRLQRTEVTPETADQARALRSAAQGHRLGAFVQLALMAGLRQGEVRGAHGRDVDRPTARDGSRERYPERRLRWANFLAIWVALAGGLTPATGTERLRIDGMAEALMMHRHW